MTWFRLDDGFFTHPKAMAAGLHGRALYLAAGCWAAQNLTDGQIPKHAIATLAAISAAKPSAARTLVEVGLWHDRGDHYEIHDYLAYNPPRSRIEADRQAAAERQSKHRNGRSNGVTSTVTNAVTDAVTDGVTNAVSHGAPYPSPLPKDLSSSNGVQTRAPEEDGSAYEQVIAAIVRQRANHAAKGPGWITTVTAQVRADKGDRIRKLLDEFPDAPLSMIADQAEDRPSPYLAQYRRQAAPL